MSRFQDREGVWVTYDWDQAPYVIHLYQDVVPASRACASQGYGKVLFWPFGTDLRDAINWWTNEGGFPLENSVVHFFYVGGHETPFCEDVDRTEWVEFDHTAQGKICSACQEKLGRTIK